MAGLPIIPTENAMQTTLDAQLNQGATSATLANDFSTQLTGVSTARPAWAVIDRVDNNGVSTPTKREYVKITGVSGQTITIGARGEAGSTDQVHSVGAILEFVPDVSSLRQINSTFAVEHSATDGTHSSALVTTLKATGAEVTTGTEDAKIVTPKALKDAGIVAVTPYSDWQTISATLTYSSADDPTFVVSTDVDLTTIIPVGARIKLTQTTAKFFIVTAITSNSITLYGGTDYDLANAAITSPYFSTVKAPLGFPLDPDKWTVVITSTSQTQQVSPAQNTWYNHTSGVLHIGVWNVTYSVVAFADDDSAGGRVNPTVFSTLSTANNSESNSDFTAHGYGGFTTDMNSYIGFTFTRTNVINLASKTTYYLNIKTNLANQYSIQARGDVVPTKIKAVCAYL